MCHDRQCLTGGVSQFLGSGTLNEYGLECLVARCSYCQVGISVTVPPVPKMGIYDAWSALRSADKFQ